MAFSITTLLFCAASLALLIAIPSSGENHLLNGQRLSPGQSLTQGNYQFIMQTDCNLVLYDGGAVWASGTWHKGNGCFAILQSDGNFVIYDNNNKALWASNTNKGGGNYILILQRDRNVVLYSNPLWATGTNRFGTSGVVIAAAQNGTVGISGAEQNKVSEMPRIVELINE